MGINQSHRLIVLFFIMFVAANDSSQLVPCKPEWYLFGEKCYKILPLDFTRSYGWINSIEACLLYGGNLASIYSGDLQEFLTTFLLLNAKSNAWIGLHDRNKESEFSWVDGSIYNYTNWDENQPSRLVNSNEEDCVEMRYTKFKSGVGTWNDATCSSLRPYVCQVNKSDDTNSPDTRFCSIEDGGGWKYLNSCYHVVKEEKSWEDAEKYCEEKYKGYLVSILDDNAEVFLNYIMKISDLSKNVWIGIKMGNYSMQKWTSGWHVANKKFNEGRLHYINGTCAVKTSWNSWAVAPCHNKYPFICEKIKNNVPVLQKPPSDDWKCPFPEKKWLDFGGEFCYYLEDKLPLNWLEANYECGKKGGTLACFHSENETNILHPHILESQDRMYIGIRRSSANRNEFEWADGKKVIYRNWHRGEPNNINEICGELWTESMKWNDVPCDQVKGYICKTKKVFSSTKMENISDQVKGQTCSPDFQRIRRICSGGVAAGPVLGIVFFTFLVGLLIGVAAYHYRECWKKVFIKSKNDGYTSAAPESLGYISEKVIWKPEEEEIHC